MNPVDFEEYKFIKNNPETINQNILNRNLNKTIEKFNLPKSYYFKILNDRCKIHWAIIKEEDNKTFIYFINIYGQVFDKLEFENIKIAKRLLRKNHFISSNNKKCPYKPIEPLFLKLNNGKKSAPYSKGNLWIPQERYKNLNIQKKQRKSFFSNILNSKPTRKAK